MELVSYGSKIEKNQVVNMTDDMKIKRTYGKPKLEYKTSYLNGFELVEEPFLFLTLYYANNNNFELKIPLNHLDIKENQLIPEINIHDDDNRYLADILDSIYKFNGVFLDDVIDKDGIFHNLDINELCNYINDMSMLEIVLFFEEDELVHLDLFRILFPYGSKYNDKFFENPNDYKLNFSLVVSDLGNLYIKYSNSRV